MIDDRKIFRIDRQELERRWAAARAHMDRHGLDALVMQNTRDFHGGYVKWFTDIPAANPRTVIFHRDDWMTVIDHGASGRRRALDGNDRDHPGVGALLMTAAIPSASATQDIDARAVVEILRHRGYRKVGLVGAASAPYGFVAHLMGAFGGRLTDETDAVDLIKAIKSPYEISLMREAAALQDKVFARVLDLAKPGMRDLEISALARYEAERLGSEQALFLASSAPTGQAALFATRHFQGRTVRPGDQFLLLVENAGLGGYYAEMVRIIVFGAASQELKDGFALACEAQRLTQSLLVPGARPADIAAANDDFLTRHGYEKEARIYAHGHGYDIVERPLIRGDETMCIAACMNVSVHPALGTPAFYATVGDNFVVREEGPAERLHATAQQIFEI